MNQDAKFYTMSFGGVYPLYVKKAERKGRTQAEVDQIVLWLTGYSEQAMRDHIAAGTNFEQFFAQAPLVHPNASKIKGVICGYRVEDIQDKLVQQVRWLDKLIDELANGKAMEKILRGD